MKCRFCKNKKASSKEHLIANSRLKDISSIHSENRPNDNVRKKFKGITCEEFNNNLGKYEGKKWSGLAYATAWKILAGNINKAFDKHPAHQLKNTIKNN